MQDLTGYQKAAILYKTNYEILTSLDVIEPLRTITTINAVKKETGIDFTGLIEELNLAKEELNKTKSSEIDKDYLTTREIGDLTNLGVQAVNRILINLGLHTPNSNKRYTPTAQAEQIPNLLIINRENLWNYNILFSYVLNQFKEVSISDSVSVPSPLFNEVNNDSFKTKFSNNRSAEVGGCH